MSFDREAAGERLLNGGNVVMRRVHSAWNNFVGKGSRCVTQNIILTSYRFPRKRQCPRSCRRSYVSLVDLFDQSNMSMTCHRIATSFTAVVNSLVSDVLLPPISLLPFMSHKNLPEKFWVLRKGPHGDDGYNTIKQAAEDGAVTMAYGFLCFYSELRTSV